MEEENQKSNTSASSEAAEVPARPSLPARLSSRSNVNNLTKQGSQDLRPNVPVRPTRRPSSEGGGPTSASQRSLVSKSSESNESATSNPLEEKPKSNEEIQSDPNAKQNSTRTIASNDEKSDESSNKEEKSVSSDAVPESASPPNRISALKAKLNLGAMGGIPFGVRPPGMPIKPTPAAAVSPSEPLEANSPKLEEDAEKTEGSTPEPDQVHSEHEETNSDHEDIRPPKVPRQRPQSLKTRPVTAHIAEMLQRNQSAIGLVTPPHDDEKETEPLSAEAVEEPESTINLNSIAMSRPTIKAGNRRRGTAIKNVSKAAIAESTPPVEEEEESVNLNSVAMSRPTIRAGHRRRGSAIKNISLAAIAPPSVEREEAGDMGEPQMIIFEEPPAIFVEEPPAVIMEEEFEDVKNNAQEGKSQQLEEPTIKEEDDGSIETANHQVEEKEKEQKTELISDDEPTESKFDAQDDSATDVSDNDEEAGETKEGGLCDDYVNVSQEATDSDSEESSYLDGDAESKYTETKFGYEEKQAPSSPRDYLDDDIL